MRHLASLALLIVSGVAYPNDKPDCDPSSGLALDASCLERQVSGDEQLPRRSDEDAAGPELMSRDDQFCARTSKNELELGYCLREQADYAERELNETYRKAMARQPAARKSALRQEERRWIKWREAECARQVKDVEDCVRGCGVPWTMRLKCMTKEAENRVMELKIKWGQ
jgi:uncharacterized protein YecT (DUF1311 family)